MSEEICTSCYHVGTPIKIKRFSWLIWFVLSLVGIVPGLIYMLWALNQEYLACPNCGGKEMIPVDSGRGQQLLRESHQPRIDDLPIKAKYHTTAFTERKCPFCAETIKAEAIICRFCNRDLPPIEPKHDSVPIAETPSPGIVEQQEQPAESISSLVTSSDPPPDQQGKHESDKSRRRIIAVMLGTALLIVMGGIAYTMTMRANQKKHDPAAAPQQPPSLRSLPEANKPPQSILLAEITRELNHFRSGGKTSHPLAFELAAIEAVSYGKFVLDETAYVENPLIEFGYGCSYDRQPMQVEILQFRIRPRRGYADLIYAGIIEKGSRIEHSEIFEASESEKVAEWKRSVYYVERGGIFVDETYCQAQEKYVKPEEPNSRLNEDGTKKHGVRSNVTAETKPVSLPATVSAPVINVGDRYTYKTTSTDSNGKISVFESIREVTAIDGDRVTVTITSEKTGKARTLIYDRSWNLLETGYTPTAGLIYKPAIKYFDFPLTMGKKWTANSTETDKKTGKTRQHIVNGEVVEWGNGMTADMRGRNLQSIKIVLKTEVTDGETTVTGNDISWYFPAIGKSGKSELTGINSDGVQEKKTAIITSVSLIGGWKDISPEVMPANKP